MLILKCWYSRIYYIIVICVVLQIDGEELFDKHVEQWQRLYQQAGVHVEGNLKIVCMDQNHILVVFEVMGF